MRLLRPFELQHHSRLTPPYTDVAAGADVVWKAFSCTRPPSQMLFATRLLLRLLPSPHPHPFVLHFSSYASSSSPHLPLRPSLLPSFASLESRHRLLPSSSLPNLSSRCLRLIRGNVALSSALSDGEPVLQEALWFHEEPLSIAWFYLLLRHIFRLEMLDAEGSYQFCKEKHWKKDLAGTIFSLSSSKNQLRCFFGYLKYLRKEICNL